jgi:hypothetical protein
MRIHGGIQAAAPDVGLDGPGVAGASWQEKDLE